MAISISVYPLSLIHQAVIAYKFGTSTWISSYWIEFSTLIFICTPILAMSEALSLELKQTNPAEYNKKSQIFSERLNLIILYSLILLFFIYTLTYLTPREWYKRSRYINEFISLLPVLSLGIVLLQINTVLSSVLLTCKGETTISQLNKFLSVSCSIVVVYFFGTSLGVAALAYAMVISGFVFLAIQFLVLYKFQIKYNPLSTSRSPVPFIKSTSLFILYIIFSNFLTMIVKYFLQYIDINSVSAYQYAISLCSIPENVIINSFHVVLWSMLCITQLPKPREIQRLFLIIKITFLILICCSLVFITFSSQIIHLLLLRGAFNEQSLALSSQALGLLSVSLAPQAVCLLAGRYVFFRYGNIASVGWLMQGLVGLLAAIAGVWLKNMHLVMLYNTIGAIFGSVFFYVYIAKTAGNARRSHLLFIGKILIICIALSQCKFIHSLEISSHWGVLNLSFQGSLYVSAFVTLVFILKVVSWRELSTIFTFLNETRR